VAWGAASARPSPLAGAVVLTALATGTAAATGRTTRSSRHPKAPIGPRSEVPVFVLDKGRFTGFDAPGPLANDNLAWIDNRGQIVGSYLQDYSVDSTGAPQGRFRGFLRDRRGRYSTIRVPGATLVTTRGINNRGQVVGEYRDAGGTYHRFLWDKGRVVNVDRGPAGGAACCSLFDLNDRGQMVGAYPDTAGVFHGLLLDRGRAVTIDASGVAMTFPLAINNRGRIVGATCTTSPCQQSRGFLLREGAGGPFTPINVPGAPGTAASGINDAGTIVGPYTNPNARPSPQPSGAAPMGRMA
jgi:probable HAF family extracellular repeat protein